MTPEQDEAAVATAKAGIEMVLLSGRLDLLPEIHSTLLDMRDREAPVEEWRAVEARWTPRKPLRAVDP